MELIEERKTRRSAKRYQRAPSLPFRLTERDIGIVHAVARHGVLRSDHVDQLFPNDSPDGLRRRLQRLFHAGYLERPTEQRAIMLDVKGSLPLAYLLTEKGSQLLRDERQVLVRPRLTKSRDTHLKHELEVADFMVGFEAACTGIKGEGVSFLSFDRILAEAPEDTKSNTYPDRWQVTVRQQNKAKKFNTRPDGIAAMERGGTRRFFFIEADRGTMDIASRSIDKPSIVRKFLAYADTYATETHKRRFNMGNMRALFVTRSRSRADHMIEAFATHVPIGVSPRLFLFIDRPTLFAPEASFLEARWRDGAGVERTLFE